MCEKGRDERLQVYTLIYTNRLYLGPITILRFTEKWTESAYGVTPLVASFQKSIISPLDLRKVMIKLSGTRIQNTIESQVTIVHSCLTINIKGKV